MASIARDTRPHETTRAFAEIMAVVDEHILGKVHLWRLIRVHWLMFNRGKQTDDTNVEVDVKFLVNLFLRKNHFAMMDLNCFSDFLFAWSKDFGTLEIFGGLYGKNPSYPNDCFGWGEKSSPGSWWQGCVNHGETRWTKVTFASYGSIQGTLDPSQGVSIFTPEFWWEIFGEIRIWHHFRWANRRTGLDCESILGNLIQHIQPPGLATTTRSIQQRIFADCEASPRSWKARGVQ